MLKPFKFDKLTNNTALYMSFTMMFLLGFVLGIFITTPTAIFMSSPIFTYPPSLQF
jgi:hypothetical protein